MVNCSLLLTLFSSIVLQPSYYLVLLLVLCFLFVFVHSFTKAVATTILCSFKCSWHHHPPYTIHWRFDDVIDVTFHHLGLWPQSSIALGNTCFWLSIAWGSPCRICFYVFAVIPILWCCCEVAYAKRTSESVCTVLCIVPFSVWVRAFDWLKFTRAIANWVRVRNSNLFGSIVFWFHG